MTMSIDEIRKARSDAEQQIRQVLHELQEKTGMRLNRVEVELVHVREIGSDGERRTVVHAVEIDLQL